MSKGIKEIVKEVENDKEINNKDLIIIMLYAMYFTGYTIGWVKRIMKEIKENE